MNDWFWKMVNRYFTGSIRETRATLDDHYKAQKEKRNDTTARLKIQGTKEENK